MFPEKLPLSKHTLIREGSQLDDLVNGPSDGTVCFVVEESGSGWGDSNRSHALQRFWGKGPGSGSGLKLSTVTTIVIFYAVKDIQVSLSARFVTCLVDALDLQYLKKFSIGALSHPLPRRLIDIVMSKNAASFR